MSRVKEHNRFFRFVVKTLSRHFPFLWRYVSRLYIGVLKAINKKQYNTWANHNEALCFAQSYQSKNPLVSIIVPAFNTDKQHFLEMIYSVINQHYQNWELIIVNASTDELCKQSINKCVNIDTRIRLIVKEKNQGISGNTNEGIKNANGDYIAFLDHDDLLHPCALHSVVREIEQNNADLVYTDEDKVNEEGGFYFGGHFKPDWSPALLENVNYINHLSIIKTSYVKGVGVLRPEYDGAQDYDLLLRIIDKYNPRVSHVPKVLYHWRAAQTSTASDITTKSYVMEAGNSALQQHLKRCKIKATSEIIANKPGFYRVKYQQPEQITVIIGEVDSQYYPNCARWLGSLLSKYGANNIQLIIEEWAAGHQIRDIHSNTVFVPEGKSYLKNAVAAATNEIVIYFQVAAMPRTIDDIFNLAAVVEQTDTFAAQPVLVDRLNMIRDSGLVDEQFGLQPLFKGTRLGENTYFGNTDWVRNISRVSCGVVAIKKSNLARVVNNNDVANWLVPYQLPIEAAYTVWAHSVFHYKGSLALRQKSKYFNSQLEHASYQLLTKNFGWEKDEDIFDE